MFDQLLQLVEQHAGQAIINNPAIPDQHNSAAIQGVTQQIFSQLQNHATSGNLQQVIALFQNGGGANLSNHPIVSSMIQSVAGTFTSQYGMSSASAQSTASSLLPTIMSQLISKTNNPNDSSFDLSSVMQTVSGNSNFDLGSVLSSFTGNSSSGTLGGLGKLAAKLFG